MRVGMADRDEVKAELRQSKMQVSLRGHEWDVADVMEVLDEFITFDAPSPGPGNRSSP